jgi:hypothetical protein
MPMGTLRLMVLALLLVFGARAFGHNAPAAQPAPRSAQSPFAAFDQFSATLNGGIGNDHDRKIYRSANLMRMNFDDSYRVTDLESLNTWSVQPDRCTQFSSPDAATYPFSAYHGYKVERSLTGENETVDGHACKIENVIYTQKDGGPFVIKMKLWEAEDLKDFPIKIEVEVNGRQLRPLHYSDVRFDPPDPKLFHHPAKCTAGVNPGQTGTVKAVPSTTPK